MRKRMFLDKNIDPSEENLKVILEDSYLFYDDLLEKVFDYKRKWTFYKGWSLKVYDKKKALFYLAPHENSFHINMAIRDTEKESLLDNIEYNKYHTKLSTAEQYSEGFKIHFEVIDATSYEECLEFILGIFKLRS